MTRVVALAVGGVLAASVCMRASNPPAADPIGTAFFLKAAERREAPEGLARACHESIRRAARFLFADVGIEHAIRDEHGARVPPYIYHAVIDDDDRFTYRASYPAYHHAYLVEAFLNYYYQDMGALPELAPEGETHLLRSATEIRQIVYGSGRVAYTSLPDSIELLKVAGQPRVVTVDGAAIGPSAGLQASNGFWFNKESGVLLIKHGGPRVEVSW